ncbi:MAG: hypothetical protein ACT6QU_02310 [Aliihoeflea sp.]|uniref:hypothetical protein n=1 Tax=Aliihoeflea sp. TaxID=2608088 RepID=UPI0040348048
MIAPLDPRRIEIARHIMEARKLAFDIDAQILEFLLESALHEAIGHDAAARKAVLGKLEDDRASGI